MELGYRCQEEVEEEIELEEELELAEQCVPLELEAEALQDGVVLLASVRVVLRESFDSKLQLSTIDVFAHSCLLLAQ